jgi:hypothetical protein
VLRPLRRAGCVLLVMAAAGVAWAQPAVRALGPGALGTLVVPGGVGALARAAGLDDRDPRGGALLTVIRVMYESPAGADRERDARLARLREYLSAVAGFEHARAALPGGRISAGLARSGATRAAAERFAGAIGADFDESGGASRLSFRDDDGSRRRRQALQDAGADAAALARGFNDGVTLTLALPADEVPLPLGPEAWSRLVVPAEGMAGNPLTALLSDRRAALLYYGLMSLEAPTRALMVSDPALLAGLLEGIRPSVVASLGRSLRVRNGRVDVPGGAEAVPLWEALVDRRISEPGRFFLELLRRDRGRLALFYDAIDHLDPPHQAFALSLRLSDSTLRLEREKALYAAFVPSVVGWDIEARPFRRIAYDAVHVLMITRVLPSGDLPFPAGRRFWETALASWDLPDDPARSVRDAGGDAAIDAAWLVDRLCVENPAKRQHSVALWQFGQRVFAGTAPSALPDVLVALRGFTRFRTLALTLDRMGIADPATYAAAARQAERLSRILDREAALTSLRQFQGALSLVERVRFGRAISSETARRLVESLSAVELLANGEYQGRIGEWLDTTFLPALARAPAPAADPAGRMGPIEATVLAAMAGSARDAAPGTVEWEGLQYRADVGAAEFSRLAQVRQKQGGYALDAVLAYCREIYRLPLALKSTSDVPARVAALTAAAKALELREPYSLGPDVPMPDLPALLDAAVAGLRRITRPKDVPTVALIANPLRRASDRLLAAVLISLAYAPHLGDPDGAALMAGDPAQRHSFGLDERVLELRSLNPWRIPQESVGEAGGWRATGSALGLDVGLAELVLRRLASDSLPPPPLVNDIDRLALAESVAFSNPSDASDAERDAIVDAIRRGRARVRGLHAHPEALPGVLRAAAVGEWRQEILPWALEREPDRVPDYFALAELLRIGEAESTPLRRPDAWGTSSVARDGCLCLRYPDSMTWETLAGRAGIAFVAENMPDLGLRVAEFLSALGLPARLARGILAFATQDVLDTGRPAYLDDWSALVNAVRHLPDARLVDAVAALTNGGPLVPADQEQPDDSRR